MKKIVPVVKIHTVHIQLHLFSLCHVFILCVVIFEVTFFSSECAFCFVFLFQVHFLKAIRQERKHISNTVKRIPHTPQPTVTSSRWYLKYFRWLCLFYTVLYTFLSSEHFAGHNKYLFIHNTVACVLAADQNESFIVI